MTTQILENYLDSIRHLPSDLQRNFGLMSEFDKKAEKLQKTINELSETYKQDAKTTDDKTKTKILKQIKQHFNSIRKCSDDKVDLAYSTYELVDQHIRHLDSDLNHYEQSLKKRDTSFSTESTSSKRRSTLSECSRPSKHSRTVSEVSARSNSRSEDGDRDSKNGDLDMPVDPNEPTYCICDKVSYGQMIGCDNSDCTIEWFHFECVGLTSQPTGQWYCPKCRE
ncbi:Inhibitor of growth protein 4 [Oopsacas minuta]|uniref:Inhibitor of growth protein n=1 Tax=Oopsacas minuta TaxID=111878 RepID=A0AAV7JYW5_9METZ|nr:Inhibitor of growth protein 4 [Oopsacas minuta]